MSADVDAGCGPRFQARRSRRCTDQERERHPCSAYVWRQLLGRNGQPRWHSQLTPVGYSPASVVRVIPGKALQRGLENFRLKLCLGIFQCIPLHITTSEAILADPRLFPNVPQNGAGSLARVAGVKLNSGNVSFRHYHSLSYIWGPFNREITLDPQLHFGVEGTKRIWAMTILDASSGETSEHQVQGVIRTVMQEFEEYGKKNRISGIGPAPTSYLGSHPHLPCVVFSGSLPERSQLSQQKLIFWDNILHPRSLYGILYGDVSVGQDSGSSIPARSAGSSVLRIQNISLYVRLARASVELRKPGPQTLHCRPSAQRPLGLACQRADWARHKTWCRSQVTVRELELKRPGARELAEDFDAWYNEMGATLYTWVSVEALDLFQHAENLHTKFVVMSLRVRKPRPAVALKMFEYVDIRVYDRAAHKRSLRGQAAEAFQAALDQNKKANDLAKTQGKPGAALVITEVLQSGGEGIARNTSILLRPSVLTQGGSIGWEAFIKDIIDEGRNIKEMFRSRERAGTLPKSLSVIS
ncbi:hypothetical protein B0H19DRAFT_1230158 [Mycena capillaripes]|nr:hypothetical protein B0H19DRAFT_1230158 [Mycena capillaripes]